MTPMTTIQAAVMQASSVAFDRERTLEKVQSLTADAAAGGAQLVVFPEAFLSAYPKGADVRRADARGTRGIPAILRQRG